MRSLLSCVLVLAMCAGAFADQYDDLVALAQQCKLESVQTEQARVVEATAERNLVTAQQARDVALAGYDQEAIDAELLRLSTELQMAVSTQNWPAFARLMGELAAVNQAREDAKGNFDSAQAKVNAASAAVTVAEQAFNKEDEELQVAIKAVIDKAEAIARQRG